MAPPHIRAVKVNQLLASLPEADNALLASVTRIERPPSGQMLSSRAEPATEIWFPHSGVVGLSVTDKEGRHVQNGLIGPEGCVGLEALFTDAPALADATVQIAGDMSVVQIAQLRPALETRPLIQAALSKFLFELASQSLQTVACNRLHTLEARCCRWLLMMQDRTGEADLPLTQESLATMLGSGRPRINALLAELERDGLLRRYRGRIHLLTRAGLKKRACECYHLLKHPSRAGVRPTVP